MRTLIFVYIIIVFIALETIAEEVVIDVQRNNLASCFVTRPFDPQKHKSVYTVGVLAYRGFPAAFDDFNTTFSEYLTLTAGRRFNPPVQFLMKPLDFQTLFPDMEQTNVDFIYVNPSAYSCIDSEYEARSLVSQVTRRKVGGQVYDLKQFGGVIAVRKDNDQINNILDLKDKIIAMASISGLGSGQMQFRQMIEAGMDYMNDPKQLVFTSNQGTVVKGVISGEFDVGFIRTDQIEQTSYANATPVDPSLLKIIDPKPNLSIDGVPFPFQSSTRLYPEWNVAALGHVAEDVQRAVQNALLSMSDHGKVATALQQCQTNFNQTYCDALNFPTDFLSSAPCDTTKEIAQTALQGMSDGHISAWTTTLSYMTLRSMQEATGFISFNKTTQTWSCIKSSQLYNSISCPADLFKKSPEEVATDCQAMGLECKEGFECVCQPCYAVSECINSVRIMDSCVEYRVLLPIILVPIALLSFGACLCILSYKSNQLIKHAKKATKNERDLNEFIAHEVRNPLAAALSACTFATSIVEGHGLVGEEAKNSLKEDINIIDFSLRFINDLLRSMLDVHRATDNQMTLEEDSVDILHDIFEPVKSMIYSRDTNFVVLIDCPTDLVVAADRLRLQQVVLNLARNAAKFVEEGFIRLRASVVNGCVCIFIEDSGPGIPLEKREQLFNHFQTSLDTLAQGTGVGLNLCKKLVDLMDGEITLDERYHSGFMDHPGVRIVVNLNKAPEEESSLKGKFFDLGHTDIESDTSAGNATDLRAIEGDSIQLPSRLRVLFVDDDRILRRQGSRAILRLMPSWSVREGASGEAALQIVETEGFDLIFMDQYMTSVEQPMKGTETVRALRAKGIESVICGLSANNLGSMFETAGADSFILKPFPCRKEDLLLVLKDLLSKRELPRIEDPCPSTIHSSGNDAV